MAVALCTSSVPFGQEKEASKSEFDFENRNVGFDGFLDPNDDSESMAFVQFSS